MKLSLAFIATKLKHVYDLALVDPRGHRVNLNDSSVSASVEFPRFTSVRLRPTRRPAGNAEDILYVIESAPLAPLPCENAKGVVWVGSDQPPADVFSLWLPSQQSTAEVLDCILDLFETYNAWNTRIREMFLEKTDTTKVVKLLDEVTDNPYWYADAALRVKCMSDDRSLSQYSSKWDYQRKTGRYPADVIAKIVSSGDLERMNQPSGAWLFDDAESYTIPFVTKAIILNGNVYGYLFVIELNQESCICDLELAETLGELIATYVRHSSFDASGTKRFAEQMLRACLAGNEVSDEERVELLEFFGWQHSPGFLVAAFDRGGDRRGFAEAPQVQVELLRDTIGIGRIFSYDVYIVLVVDTADESAHDIERRIADTCVQLGWKAGLSDEFSNFSLLEDHYGQAQIALRKGAQLNPDASLYPYRDYCLAYLCQKLALELDRPLFMHPDVERLIAHDSAADSELVKTLHAYLANERNISKTAKDLFLHRNSVIYRIDKIKSLMETDIEDSDNRIALMISLKTWLYEQERIAERPDI